MTYKEFGIQFNKTWDDRDFSKTQEEFMDAIRGLLFYLSLDNDDENNLVSQMESSYDASTILFQFQKLIEKFNEIYHPIAVTSSWASYTDKEDKELK